MCPAPCRHATNLPALPTAHPASSLPPSSQLEHTLQFEVITEWHVTMGEPVACDTSQWRRMDRTVCNRKPGCAPTGNRGYNIVSDGEGQCVAKALPRLPQRIVPLSSVLPEGTLHVSFGPFYNIPFTVIFNSVRTKLAPR